MKPCCWLAIRDVATARWGEMSNKDVADDLIGQQSIECPNKHFVMLKLIKEDQLDLEQFTVDHLESK